MFSQIFFSSCLFTTNMKSIIVWGLHVKAVNIRLSLFIVGDRFFSTRNIMCHEDGHLRLHLRIWVNRTHQLVCAKILQYSRFVQLKQNPFSCPVLSQSKSFAPHLILQAPLVHCFVEKIWMKVNKKAKLPPKTQQRFLAEIIAAKLRKVFHSSFARGRQTMLSTHSNGYGSIVGLNSEVRIQ